MQLAAGKQQPQQRRDGASASTVKVVAREIREYGRGLPRDDNGRYCFVCEKRIRGKRKRQGRRSALRAPMFGTYMALCAQCV